MKQRIMVFGGTTEGRELAQALSRLPVSLTLSVATAYGREVLPELAGAAVRIGRMTAEQMERELRGGYAWVVDATHPYAVEASRNIRLAADRSGTPLLRLAREPSGTEGCTLVGSAAEAAALLSGTTGNVLLTTGSKELAAFAGLPRARLFVRVLPTAASVQACEDAGIACGHILALQGPFTQKLNEAVLEQYHISVLVTKDGGDKGGFAEKLAAARSSDVQLVVIGRPPEKDGHSQQEILAMIRQELEADR